MVPLARGPDDGRAAASAESKFPTGLLTGFSPLPRYCAVVRMIERIVVASTLLLAACGGAHGEAKHAEPDPWAGYKGTYATSVVATAPRTTTAPVGRTRAAASAASAALAEPAVAAAAPTPATAPLPTLATTAAKGKKSNAPRGPSKKAKK